MGINLWGFFIGSRAANSTVQGPIEPIRDFMCLLVVSKNEEDPIKNEVARVVTTLFIDFSDAQGQLTPVSDGTLHKFYFIQAVMLPARMMKIRLKLKALEWSQHFSHIKSMGNFQMVTCS